MLLNFTNTTSLPALVTSIAAIVISVSAGSVITCTELLLVVATKLTVFESYGVKLFGIAKKYGIYKFARQKFSIA